MANWHVTVGGQQFGPADEAAVQQWIADGRLGPDDLVWCEGLANWERAADHFAFAPGGPAPAPGPAEVPPYQPPPSKPHRGTMILVFGILGLVSCFIFGIAAWVMGNNDLQEIRAGQMDPSGESMTNTGRILGMISTILGLAGLGIWLIAVVVLGARSAL